MNKSTLEALEQERAQLHLGSDVVRARRRFEPERTYWVSMITGEGVHYSSRASALVATINAVKKERDE